MTNTATPINREERLHVAAMLLAGLYASRSSMDYADLRALALREADMLIADINSQRYVPPMGSGP